MKGLWLENQQLSFREDIPNPQQGENEALVKVKRAGVCNTDLELIRGYYPYQGVLGHEFVGVVAEGPQELQGKRVVGEINAACGECSLCRRGMPTHCENRTVLGILNHNGAFADYVALPVKNLHPVPDHVSTDAATFVEPLAAALEIQEQVKMTENERVLLVGDGKLGQLVAQTIALTGCDLFVVGRHEEKLARLRDRGIKTGFVEDIPWRSFDLAVECTGNPDGFDIARRSLRPRGTLVLKSTYANRLTIDASSLVVDEITLMGSRCGPFSKALDLLEQDKVDVTSLIQTRYPLDQAIKAIGHAQQRGVLKVLLDMDA
ncbi:alcohol dehydrogenase catalytic domain-containing protein [Spirulina sp. CS-785/01]|uniref:MDR/zinc-dependent alcohol dehydrogenase-like family protein n=1 Tax=Spirulina sp. CS-785/01 TaxID=3021716 RepID=UPI00232F4FCF|nr:alcohol dehydrogenase catalytic domain-containing protein [Spirulina sp. CS-785/01]MDB9313024.1 alcohol dehydrogenase catalytic domain-containing protein [Spirulina sp. CS-785/01]